MSKFELQDSEYSFPYHYLTDVSNGCPSIGKNLSWGYEYLSYISVIIDEISQLDINNVLDVGCGDGYLLNHLNLGIQKCGIDLSERAIKFANAFANDTKFKVDNIFNINSEYDLITLVEVMEHIPDNLIVDFMGHIYKCIKPGGYLIISVPMDITPVTPKHYRHYNCKLLSEHVTAELSLVKDIYVYRKSLLLNLVVKLMSNRLYNIRLPLLNKLFWKWHKKYNIFCKPEDGQHLIRVYKKVY